MNSLELQNMLVEHRRNVIRLLNHDKHPPTDKMKLLFYVQDLTKQIDQLTKRILIKFEYDTNLDTHNISRSHEEPDCLTVGNFKQSHA